MSIGTQSRAQSSCLEPKFELTFEPRKRKNKCLEHIELLHNPYHLDHKPASQDCMANGSQYRAKHAIAGNSS